MEMFRPDIYQQSIFKIDYKKLKKSGIKCLLFDLDNTLSAMSISMPDAKTKSLISTLDDMGFKVIIMSNSGKKRVEPFKEHLNVDAAFKSFKPLKKKYLKILKIYNYKDTEIAAIGDQLITDIYGANRMGFTSILVNPIGDYDFTISKFSQILERKIYRKLNKLGLLTKGKYYD